MSAIYNTVSLSRHEQVRLSGLRFERYFSQHRVQINTKDLSGIEIVIRMELLNTAGKQTTTLTGIRRKLLIGKAG